MTKQWLIIPLLWLFIWNNTGCQSQLRAEPMLSARSYLPIVTANAEIKSFVLFGTPKMIADFDDPIPSIQRFFDHYQPYMTARSEMILIFAVGNSEHILQYRGHQYWNDFVAWANLINNEEVYSEQTLTYEQIFALVQEFKSEAQRRGWRFKIYDQIDQAYEFTRTNFKSNRHPESMVPESPWSMYAGYEIMATLRADDFIYATQPDGIPEGKNAGDFLVEQVAAYVHDLQFDGILYGNQLGTRGHWSPTGGPGFSTTEAAAIHRFFQYSDQILGEKELMWFDSYNALPIERDRYSMPRSAYQYMDYLMISGFCVITTSERYLANLESKLILGDETRLLATLDYVDPWYTYDSWTEFPEESSRLEAIALANFPYVDGLVMFANDEFGDFIPAHLVQGFADRLWSEW